MYMLSGMIREYGIKVGASASFGSRGDMNYAVKIDALGGDNDFYSGSLPEQLAAWKVIKEFKRDAKTDHVDAKGKATKGAIRRWVTENKPKEFYAQWRMDTANYKDDSVEIFYKK